MRVREVGRYRRRIKKYLIAQIFIFFLGNLTPFPDFFQNNKETPVPNYQKKYLKYLTNREGGGYT